MWLKILKYTIIIARATGLEASIRKWVEARLNAIEKRVLEVDEVMSPEPEDD